VRAAPVSVPVGTDHGLREADAEGRDSMFNSNLQRVFLIVVVAILLMFIGDGTNNEWLGLIGALLFTVSLVWGGLFLAGEHIALRIALLVVGGLGAINLFSSSSSSILY
jgi:disulfide bond formation protein DsbB